MTAPVRHKAITAHGLGVILVSTLATVANDGVVGNVLVDWNRVDDFHEPIVRRKGIHAIRHLVDGFSTERIDGTDDFGPGLQQGERTFHQLGPEPAQPTGSHIGSTMRCGHENGPADFFPMLKNQSVSHQLFRLRRKTHGRRWFIKEILPHFIPGIRDHQSANHPAHAMSNDDHFLLQGETFLDGIQLLAQDGGRVLVRVTAGVAIKPKLVALSDIGVGAKRVNEWSPGGGGIHQTVHTEHDLFTGIVRLEAGDLRGLGIFLRVQQPRKFQFLGVLLRQHYRQGNGEVGCQRVALAIQLN